MKEETILSIINYAYDKFKWISYEKDCSWYNIGITSPLWNTYVLPNIRVGPYRL